MYFSFLIVFLCQWFVSNLNHYKLLAFPKVSAKRRYGTSLEIITVRRLVALSAIK